MAFCCLTVSGKFGFCHGLGIVDSNELNSYLDYCSYRREYRIWGRKGKRNPSIGRKGVLSIGRATALILCLFVRAAAFVDIGINAALDRHSFYMICTLQSSLSATVVVLAYIGISPRFL